MLQQQLRALYPTPPNPQTLCCVRTARRRAERWAASGRTASGAQLSSAHSSGPRAGLAQAPSARSIAEIGSVLRGRASERARDLFSSVEVGPMLGRGAPDALFCFWSTMSAIWRALD